MNLVLGESCKGVRVDQLRGRAMFVHGDSFYRVVDTIGDGIKAVYPSGHVLCTNQKIGTLRLLRGDVHVVVVTPCDEEIRLREATPQEIRDVLK